MDLSQAAFGLDIRVASRIYFISPVLNPQVEAQAIGRVRRISQQKPVSVETLVLRGSIDEVLLERKQHMTLAEHRQAKSILDIRPIYNWIRSTKIIPLPESDGSNESQMAPLRVPQPVFGSGFGKSSYLDDGIFLGDTHRSADNDEQDLDNSATTNGTKRTRADDPDANPPSSFSQKDCSIDLVARPARRIRFAE